LTPDIKKISNILTAAGKNILLPAFQEQSNIRIKHDGSIVTETDLACQHYLQRELTTLSADIDFLGEEMAEAEQVACLQSNRRFWCVDPLDGTSNFATPMPLFAISVALIEAGKPTLACIHDPIRQETFTALRGQGSHLNGLPMSCTNNKKLTSCVGFLDFKRLNQTLATRFATQKIYRSQRNLGTCALEWAWLAAGRAEFIIHGDEKLWDYAAGSLLAEESGCSVSNFAHQHPFSASTLSSSILAAPPAIHTQLQPHLQTTKEVG